jgi:hypothetical protein
LGKKDEKQDNRREKIHSYFLMERTLQ